MSSDQKHRVIVGPFRPVLEAALAGQICAAQRDDPGAPVLVLVGSNMLAMYLRRRLAERNPLWNVRFLTFTKLARKLGLARLRSPGRRALPGLAQRLIVRDVIRQCAAGGYFEPVADLPGFVKTTAASITDLKEAGLAPAALGKVKGAKLAAFRTIFAGYESSLGKLGLYDDADLMAAAAESAAQSPLVASAGLIAYGFYDLNGLQRRLLLALASRARSATAMVPGGAGPAYAYGGPLIEWLSRNGFAAQAAATEEDSLAGRLFAPPRGTPTDAADFRVLSVPGEPREAREIVRQVLEFAARGIPFHEIGILLRSPEAYSRLLRDAFDRRGIPYFVSGGTPLRETRQARSLEMLASLIAGDLPRDEVMQFIHFAPIAFDKLLGHGPNTSNWDLLSIAAGIVAGPGEWTRRLAELKTRAGDGDQEHALPLHELPHLTAFVRELIAAKESVPVSGTWADTAGGLLRVYEHFVESSDDRDRICTEARKLIDLDEINPETTLDEVREAIADLLGRQRSPAKGFQRGKVYIGGLFESRGLGFRAVIVPGLVEKAFPAAGRQDPIVLDGERAVISGATGAHLPGKSGRVDEEKMLFALAVSAAAECVTLTFSRLDVAAARDRIPSHFLARLAEALTGERYDHESLERAPGFSRVSMFPGGAGDQQYLDLDDYDLRAIAGLVEAGKPERALYLAAVSEQFKRGVEAETARWQEKHFTQFDGIVSQAAHRTIAGDVVSPTRIERFAACPFAYFLQRVLNIQPLEEPERMERIAPLDRGALIHRAFCRAYTERFRNGATASAGELSASLRDAANAEFRRLRAVPPALTWALDQAEILRDLDRFATLDAADCLAAGARPAMFETRFGMPPRSHREDRASTERPLELVFGGKSYKFKGMIDRIDELGEGEARVIDYKTGRKSGKPNTFAGGTALQLPIYILAAQMLRPNRRAVGAEYAFATERGGFSSVEFTREALDARMNDLERIIVTAEQCIQNGIFIATPHKDRCRYCDFKDVCGANQDVIFERKKGDPAIAGLLEMAEIE